MRTNGDSNDALMILVPVGVLVACGVVMFGGPTDALDAMHTFVRELAGATASVVSAMFS